MIPLEVQSHKVCADKFHQDDDTQDDTGGKDGDGQERGAGAYGVIHHAGAGVLVGGEDGALVVGDFSRFIEILGHEGGDVGAGEAGNEGKTGDTGDAHEEFQEGLKKFPGRAEGT